MPEIQRFHVGARLSECSVYGAMVFLAGQVASSKAGDIKAQTSDVLSKIDRLLAEAGSSKAHMLMAQIFLSDMAEFGAMNEVWDAWVVSGSTPCRATVQAKMAHPDCKIEIVVTAARAS
jgi:enamine deaminase RidA (YjgF/YER057c/UK114 family)